MEPSERVQLHETCVVPCRLTASGVEFCLVSPIAENRWEFPKVGSDSQKENPRLVLEEAAALAGLRGDLQVDKPLGQFTSARGNESRSMIGYLMHVTDVADSWPQQANYRRRWCLAEEARARIRRKPLRRFIDDALHSVDTRIRPSVQPLRPVNGQASPRKHN